MTRRLIFPVLLALTGCGGADASAEKGPPADPAIGSALADQIMVDPDLAGQNRGDAALTGGGPVDGGLPPEIATPESVAAAKADALKAAGGSLRSAPASSAQLPARSADDTVTGMALRLPRGLGVDCPAKADYTMAWAARMPASFPIYPRGHVREAAGTDQDGCRLRAINFVTAVSPDDVLDFYFTLAGKSGFSAQRRREGEDDVLGGARGPAAYLVYVRTRPDATTEVDLVVNGG